MIRVFLVVEKALTNSMLNMRGIPEGRGGTVHRCNAATRITIKRRMCTPRQILAGTDGSEAARNLDGDRGHHENGKEGAP